MSIYVSVIFLVILLASFYKKRASISTRFLMAIFLGWIISIVSLVLYLSKHNYYWQEVNSIFFMTKNISNLLTIKVKVRPDILIRGINIGVGLLYYSALCFGIAFTSKESKKNRIKYLLLIIPSLIQVILFDPMVQKNLQIYVGGRPNITFEVYNNYFNAISNGFKIINLSYCIGMIIILVHYYLVHPKISFLKRYTLFNIFCISPITIIFYYMFRWYPGILVRATVKRNYYNYLVPDFKIRILNNPVYYILFLIIYITLLIYIYKYNNMESYYRRNHANINISIDTASLGINTFTHAIKNHIQGIHSETEYLSSLPINNEESMTSIKFILESCNACFTSIEYANKQLKNIHLNLKLIPIKEPIEAVVDKYSNNHQLISLVFVEDEPNIMAYIDQEALVEVMNNLISNAIESVGEKANGEIEIRIREQGSWGIIEIKDNGIGIEEENIDKVFTPFFSTKSSTNNWGVGLAYCYKVITAHDGKITVASKEGEGTVFSIALPII